MADTLIDRNSEYRLQLSGEYGYDALTDIGYELADRNEEWLEAHPGMHTPSLIAGGIGSNTTQVKSVLTWMEKHVIVTADGNGYRRKYGSRLTPSIRQSRFSPCGVERFNDHTPKAGLIDAARAAVDPAAIACGDLLADLFLRISEVGAESATEIGIESNDAPAVAVSGAREAGITHRTRVAGHMHRRGGA